MGMGVGLLYVIVLQDSIEGLKADVNALNARLPRHFADVVQGNDATRWGFRGDF
jgi:hypothetical protein